MIIRVPASTANLGPGFDALGCALGLYAHVSLDPDPSGRAPADEHHGALQAFRSAGGTGPLWVSSQIPMGRGLGSSAALRVGGVVAALVQRHGPDVDVRDPRFEVMRTVTALEGHGDNAAAALFGGVVVTADTQVVGVTLAVEPAVVVWVPEQMSKTASARRRLPVTVPFEDAVFNVGRAALLVAALAAGRVDVLDTASADRLHQDQRLERHPESRQAFAAAVQAGAWGVWLSGSGPTIACWCAPTRVHDVMAALPSNGRARVLSIDHDGVVIDHHG
jgi:homoserine kinase